MSNKKRNKIKRRRARRKIVSEEEMIAKAMRIKGWVRGAVFKTDAQYILDHAGKKGLEAVEEETKKLGYPIDYDQIDNMGKYPCAMRFVSILAAKRALNWEDEQIVDMGRCAPRYSFVTKMMLRYFVSLESIVKKLPIYWERHWSIGTLEGELHKDEKHLIIRLKNFESHPLGCKYMAGYCLGALSMIKKFKKLTIEETKCMNKGDKYHEYLVRWED